MSDRSDSAPRVPQLCRSRERRIRDRAYVRLGGKKLYLGVWGSEEAVRAYAELAARLRAGEPLLDARDDVVTVGDLVALYLVHLEKEAPEGSNVRETTKLACRPLLRLYESMPLREFGPRHYRAVREDLINRGCCKVPEERYDDLSAVCRKTVNARMKTLLRMFKWAVAEELAPADLHYRLDAVENLRAGSKQGLRESKRVEPVSAETIDRVLPFLGRQVAALVQLQRYTGARPGELFGICARDIDMTDPTCWLYRPKIHKNSWREGQQHERVIAIGRRAQEVIRPFLTDRPIDRPLFCPREATEDRMERDRARRQTPLSCGNRPREGAFITGGDMYTTDSYRRALHRGCRRAGVPLFNPHQVRHLRATEVERETGSYTAASAVLGHANVSATRVYVEMNRKLALEVARKTG